MQTEFILYLYFRVTLESRVRFCANNLFKSPVFVCLFICFFVCFFFLLTIP